MVSQWTYATVTMRPQILDGKPIIDIDVDKVFGVIAEQLAVLAHY